MQLTRIIDSHLPRILIASVGLWSLTLAWRPLAACADQIVNGPLESLNGTQIVVGGTTYRLEGSTVFLTGQGQKLDPAAITRGTMVVVEVDDIGRVSVVRALAAN